MITLKIVPKVIALNVDGLTTIEMALSLVDSDGKTLSNMGTHTVVTHNDGNPTAGSLNLSDMGALAKECTLLQLRMDKAASMFKKP